MELDERLDVASTTIRSVHEVLRFPITKIYVVAAASPNPVAVHSGGRSCTTGCVVIRGERTQPAPAWNIKTSGAHSQQQPLNCWVCGDGTYSSQHEICATSCGAPILSGIRVSNVLINTMADLDLCECGLGSAVVCSDGYYDIFYLLNDDNFISN
jgi:ribosomal protein L37E